MSAKNFREGNGLNVPIELWVESHEFKGVHEKGERVPGLTPKEMKEICPDIVINEIEEDKPWNEGKSIENEEEYEERVKRMLEYKP